MEHDKRPYDLYQKFGLSENSRNHDCSDLSPN